MKYIGKDSWLTQKLKRHLYILTDLYMGEFAAYIFIRLKHISIIDYVNFVVKYEKQLQLMHIHFLVRGMSDL